MPADKNIFETASHLLGKKKPEPKSKKKTPSSPKNARLDSETEAMINEIKTMQEDLQAKFDYIEQKSALLGPTFQKNLQENPNLTPAELSYLEKAKRLLGEKVWGAVGLPPKGTTQASAPATPSQRKGKTLGARKKWMPVK